VTAIRCFARLIADPARDYPQLARDRSRAALADTVGCMFAGARRPVAVKALSAFRDSAPGDCVVVGHQARLHAPFAALVNGSSAHALDYDDYDAPANSHPSAVIFPALLAMANGQAKSGADLLDAHVVGVEIIQRLGEAMNMAHYYAGWHTTMTLGTVGASAACARLFGFDEHLGAHALSIAASMASGLTNQGGFDTKPLHAGLTAQNAVLATTLAASGVTASDEVIDGRISLAKAMGEYQPDKFDAALAKLARPWSIVEHGLIAKAYPSCGYTHRLIDAALKIYTEHRPEPGRINGIRASVPLAYLDLLTYTDPRTTAEAMFSAEYNIAAVLVQGRFNLASVDETSLADADIRRLCAVTRIEPREPRDAQIPYDPCDPDWVEVTLDDGQILTASVEIALGDPANPMNNEQLRAKFDNCTQDLLPDSRRAELWSLLSGIEQLSDIAELYTLLTSKE